MTSTNWPGYLAPDASADPFLIDAGVLTIGGVAVGDIIGPSRGGFTFDPGMELREVEFDGKSSPTIENHRVIKWDSHLKGKIIGAKSAMIMKYLPGSASDGSSGGSGNTITPIAARQLFTANEYLSEVYLIGNRTDGQLIRIYFPYAMVVKWSIAGADNNEWETDIDIQAVNPKATPNICPFTIQEAS